MQNVCVSCVQESIKLMVTGSTETVIMWLNANKCHITRTSKRCLVVSTFLSVVCMFALCLVTLHFLRTTQKHALSSVKGTRREALADSVDSIQ